jgi:hypothetical protein
MAKARLFFLVNLLFVLWAAEGVQAREVYPAKIPNGEIFNNQNASRPGCQICHVSAEGGGVQTRFGEDVAEHKNGVGSAAQIPWILLAKMDSDGDGLSNGEELGDPCAVWVVGDSPFRTDNLSNPGDADDVVANLPPAQCPDAGPAPADAGAQDDGGIPVGIDGGLDDPPPGGCPCTGENGMADLTLTSAIPAFWWLGRPQRRRRRRRGD